MEKKEKLPSEPARMVRITNTSNRLEHHCYQGASNLGLSMVESGRYGIDVFRSAT